MKCGNSIQITFKKGNNKTVMRLDGYNISSPGSIVADLKHYVGMSTWQLCVQHGCAKH